MKNIFTKHPHSIGETYWQHMKFAFEFGLNMLAGGLFCIIHGIFPFLFKKKASDFLLKMMHNFIDRAPTFEERMNPLLHIMQKKLKSSTIQSLVSEHGHHGTHTGNRVQ